MRHAAGWRQRVSARSMATSSVSSFFFCPTISLNGRAPMRPRMRPSTTPGGPLASWATAAILRGWYRREETD